MCHRRSLLLSLLLFSAGAGADGSLATAVVEHRELPHEVRLDGVVEAVNQTTVSAQTAGQVEEILFDVDDFVEKDQVIARLKDTEQRARLTQVEADLKSANAQLQQAREDYERIKGVFDRGAISQADLDRASATLKSAQARRDAAVAGISQVKEQFGYTVIRAPYSGIVTQRHVEVGEIANPGQPVMSGISLDQLRVNVDVPQSLIPQIRKIGKARVQQPGDGYIPVEKLTIFPFAHHGSNTFKVRLELPEGTPGMVPGMYVKGAFEVGTERELVAPQQAVVHRSEVTAVYVVGTDGRLTFRHIRTGHPHEDGTIGILAGLAEGEQVALDPVAATALLKQQYAGRGHD